MTGKTLVLALALIPALFPAPATRAAQPAAWQKTLAQAYQHGIDSYKKKEYSRAISEFKIYQQSALAPAAANYYLGLCYYQLMQYPQAARAFEETLREAHTPQEEHFAQVMLETIRTQKLKPQTSPRETERKESRQAQENQSARLRQALNKRVEEEALAIIDSATQRSQKILQAAKLEIEAIEKEAQEELERMENRNFLVPGRGILQGFSEEEKQAVWQKAHQKMETIRAQAKEESDEILERAKLNARKHLSERLLTQEHQFVRTYKH